MQITRVHRSKSSAKKFYNKFSRYYNAISGSTEQKYWKIGLKMLNIKLGEKILEIGSGTGEALAIMAGQLGNGDVTAVDISENMINIAKQRTSSYDNIKYINVDISTLDLQENIFDAIFISFTLELFDTPEIPILLDKLKYTLKPDGRIVVVSLYKPSYFNPIVKIYELIHNKFPSYIDCRPIDLSNQMNQYFKIKMIKRKSMYGIPVEIVLAINN